MQILSAEQIRAWDQYTIQHEPVASIDLMERAARKCVDWLKDMSWKGRNFRIFCGKGNNGGDGLAIGRMLLSAGYTVSFYILEFGKLGSEDFQTNLQRLHDIPATDLHFLQSASHFPILQKEDIVVDALFGAGLNKPLSGLSADLVGYLNHVHATVVSIDLPSGLFMDQSSLGNTVIQADYTLTFQCYKTGLLLQENAPFIGEIQVLDIGLHPDYLQQTHSQTELLDEVMIRKIFRPRKRFAHKGSFGHALLVGGSYGKMGALVLATKACLGTGAGLTTAFLPKCGYGIMQTALPEAMTLIDESEDKLTTLPDDIDRFSAIGIGPGMGTAPETASLLSFVLRRYSKPLVIDADGLNCLSQHKGWLTSIPHSSILTPHPKEFDRLFGDHPNDFERMATARQKATELNLIVVLKGHHTLIACPDGQAFFNSTGNAGMAKGGSGDVLTGIISSLLAQGYSPIDAAKLGVYIHGWAGDVAAKRFSKEAMLPSHLVDGLSHVFLLLQS
ncbi:NAD(P)H-hydrate dehydratase [Flavisolibacter nicotianae]|uniref:NAD(P)H-hydrate dehydratase n=1 Tax=Flavisolibacter nicotianae TaxID=2364882 RepID=UPI000EB20AE3|nr:NAD(P)H-hydrate dehydratase [Flavisolibacter nicotianae]